RFARACEHCGGSERPDDPVLEVWIAGEQRWLHRGCQSAWLASTEPGATAPAGLPAGSKVVGIAPGQRCELCGAGRYVFAIALPGEAEAAPRHKSCAARYWEARA